MNMIRDIANQLLGCFLDKHLSKIEEIKKKNCSCCGAVIEK